MNPAEFHTFMSEGLDVCTKLTKKMPLVQTVKTIIDLLYYYLRPTNPDKSTLPVNPSWLSNLSLRFNYNQTYKGMLLYSNEAISNFINIGALWVGRQAVSSVNISPTLSVTFHTGKSDIPGLRTYSESF